MLEISSALTGRRWTSLPFTDHCQPLYRDSNDLEFLTKELIRTSQNKHTPHIEVRWELPKIPGIQQKSLYVQHTLNLDQDIESISRSLHRTQRQNIKTAEKNGLYVKRGENLEYLQIFYQLHCQTRRRQGVPVQPWRFFELLFKRVIGKGHGFILLAYKDEQCLAAGLFLHWNTTLCYKYAASTGNEQTLRPNHLLTWVAVCWGCENGYKILDFGRSDNENEGLRTYKNRWGANEIPLTYSYFSNQPSKLSSGREAAFLQKFIRISPLWVCRLTGEVLYRHFG